MIIDIQSTVLHVDRQIEVHLIVYVINSISDELETGKTSLALGSFLLETFDIFRDRHYLN